MDITSTQIEDIVRQVLGSMGRTAAAPATLPTKFRAAMLVGSKKIEVQEIPLPQLGDNDILVKVEGAGIC